MSFNSLILFWFKNNRREMPWRGASDPYKIWISEVILQQTRVNQGTDYYLRFVKRFPTVHTLAEASEQEVLKLWQGLGYYSRARNLHISAKYIVNELNSQMPDNYIDLLKLKGVGEYTAAAIASIAYGEAVPAIDGNAFRVLSRYFNIDMDITKNPTKKYFRELGMEIIDRHNPGDFNQAVMELGATVCLSTNPKCEICPLNESCEALKKGTVEQLPVKSKTVKIKNRFLNFLEITDGNNFLLTRRTGKDVWKNMYTFPLIELKKDEKIEEYLNSISENFENIWNETHLLTHQRLNIRFWQLETDIKTLEELNKRFQSKIYSKKDLSSLPLPKPMERFLMEI